MRRAIVLALRATATVALFCACLPACRTSDFDGLSRGEHASVDIGPSDQTSDADQAAPDAGGVDAEGDASTREPQREPDDVATIDAGATDAGTTMDAASDARADDARDADLHDATRDAMAALDSATANADAGPITIQLPILADRDDALWATQSGVLEELLHFGPGDGAAGFTVELGTDSEQCRIGLRFALPFGHGAQILSAKLALRRVGPDSNADASSTMNVRVFDSDSVAPFDRDHLHATPGQHDPGSVWLGQSVGGFAVGASGAWAQSADLAMLIQHVIDRSGFHEGNYVGFVVSPDAMPVGQYAQFRDSFAGEDPAVLTITYRR